MDQGLLKSSENAPTYSVPGIYRHAQGPTTHQLPQTRDKVVLAPHRPSVPILAELAELAHAITAPESPLVPGIAASPTDRFDSSPSQPRVSGRILSRFLSIVAACCRSQTALVPIWNLPARRQGRKVVWAR